MPNQQPAPAAAPTPAHDDAGAILSGACFALFAYDVGFAIDLERAETRLDQSSPHRILRARRPSPSWFEYEPPPLRILTEADPIPLAGTTSQAAVEWMIYDFGAILATYRVPFESDAEGLVNLSLALENNPALQKDARIRLARMVETMGDAVERPEIQDLVEEYSIFAIDAWPESRTPAQLLESLRSQLARTLEAEQGPLVEEQIRSTLDSRMSYAPNDLVVVEWNGALVFDHAPEDVIAVLQHANVELLELRVLDRRLDTLLDHADNLLAGLSRRRLWPSLRQNRMLDTFAAVHTDTAVLFEGVNNAIKLMGNQYLARLYRLTADALDLPAWDANVLRKLSAADSVYQKMTDASVTRRMEVLEIIIILLIMISILLPFVGIKY